MFFRRTDGVLSVVQKVVTRLYTAQATMGSYSSVYPLYEKGLEGWSCSTDDECVSYNGTLRVCNQFAHGGCKSNLGRAGTLLMEAIPVQQGATTWKCVLHSTHRASVWRGVPGQAAQAAHLTAPRLARVAVRTSRIAIHDASMMSACPLLS